MLDNLLTLLRKHDHNELPKTTRKLLNIQNNKTISLKSVVQYVYLDFFRSLINPMRKYDLDT